MKLPYILALDLCMKIKRALSTNTHKSILIHIDKQIEFTTYETQLEVIKSYSKHKHGFESPLAKGEFSYSYAQSKDK